jgi:D-lyxose ketol-isomerase
MKRSEANRHLAGAEQFFNEHRFCLPPFALWTPQDWNSAGPEADEIRTRRLGWDVTDFGSGNFEKIGLLLFTLRNGRLDDPDNRKIYAEKIMVVGEGQVTPWHYHAVKTEDIINRGAGELVVELRNSNPDGSFSDTPVSASCDGVVRTVASGGSVILKPGQSITLVPRLYHQFYANPGAGVALIGEVSSVNDDATDNYFNPPVGRFPKIEEDEPPRRLLCNEYPTARR